MTDTDLKIGERLRRLRSSNSLTQEELANRAFLTKGFISQLERDQTSPSIATLKDILDVFGLRMAEFFKDDRQAKVAYQRAHRLLTSDSTEGRRIEVLVPDAQGRRMDPVLVTLEPGERSGPHGPHEGDEFGFVLKGKLILKLDNIPHKLGREDCFYFSAQRIHSVENNGSHVARILWVVTPPIF
jgi:transcriptional regulator with XRE-family HTH domain